MKCTDIKYIFILLLLKIFCLNFSQSTENNDTTRYKRKIDETTTAEPKIDQSNITTFNINVTLNPSTTTFKTTEYHDTTKPYNASMTTERFNNVHHMQSSTMIFRRIISTTAMPISNIQPLFVDIQQRKFDVVSFIGGCLFTFFLIGIGIVGWKVYALHVERSYRTI